MNELTNVTTGEVRFSYAHLFKPYAAMPGQEEKYSVTVLVPKGDVDTMNRIQSAIEAAKQKGISNKWNGQCPPVVPTPVYDGDGVRPSDGMPFGEECRGHWVFTASAKADYPPEVVDKMGNPILNQSEVYSGMYGRVNVTFFPYSFGGEKGDRMWAGTGTEAPGRGSPGGLRTDSGAGIRDASPAGAAVLWAAASLWEPGAAAVLWAGSIPAAIRACRRHQSDHRFTVLKSKVM